MQREISDGVPGPRHGQERALEVVAVEDRVVLDDGVGVFGDEIDPVLDGRGGGVGNGDATSGCVAVGGDVGAPVAPEVQGGLGIDVDLHLDQQRRLGGRRGEVGDPQVVAGLGALRA